VRHRARGTLGGETLEAAERELELLRVEQELPDRLACALGQVVTAGQRADSGQRFLFSAFFPGLARSLELGKGVFAMVDRPAA
jgi:hypothetical protein